MIFLTAKKTSGSWNLTGSYDFNLYEGINPLDISISPTADEFIFTSTLNLLNLEGSSNSQVDVYRTNFNFTRKV